MKAEEMFKEIGYRKEYLKNMKREIWGINYIKEDKLITFDLQDKEICVDYEDEAVYFNMKELEAINKQVEELGWK